jgi:hypothetical protein
MSNALAIIIGAAAIAAAILIVFRWQLVSPGAMLQDRWTGEVILCDPITRICHPITRKGPPAKTNCEP